MKDKKKMTVIIAVSAALLIVLAVVFDVVSSQIDNLLKEARNGRAFPTVKQMKQIVPEFRSKNSVYEELDD